MVEKKGPLHFPSSIRIMKQMKLEAGIRYGFDSFIRDMVVEIYFKFARKSEVVNIL